MVACNSATARPAGSPCADAEETGADKAADGSGDSGPAGCWSGTRKGPRAGIFYRLRPLPPATEY
eukprot:5745910-Alexandrium_andersonii.AAC.1